MIVKIDLNKDATVMEQLQKAGWTQVGGWCAPATTAAKRSWKYRNIELRRPRGYNMN